VSLGKTSSIISDFDSLTGLGRKFDSVGSISFLGKSDAEICRAMVW
jgi:hypothetical protein